MWVCQIISCDWAAVNYCFYLHHESSGTHHPIGLHGSEVNLLVRFLRCESVFPTRHPCDWSAERSSSRKTSRSYSLGVPCESCPGSSHGGLPLIHSSRLQNWCPGPTLAAEQDRFDKQIDDTRSRMSLSSMMKLFARKAMQVKSTPYRFISFRPSLI